MRLNRKTIKNKIMQDKTCTLEIGTLIGLCDSKGVEMKIGDTVKVQCSISSGLHGDWTYKEVTARGVTPIFSYLTSEKKQVIPVACSSGIIADYYDRKSFLTFNDLKDASPMDDEFYIVPSDEVPQHANPFDR